MSSVPPRSDIPRAGGPPKNRVPILIATALGGAAAYYFFTAGGDSHVAKKAAEHDASRVSSAVRDEVPGRGKEYKKSAEETMARVGSTVDRNVEEGKQRISEGVEKFDDAKEKAKHNVMGKIDEVDRNIEAEASKAKGGIMSWFGK
ncbi:hypothetical protein BDD12DRAFT_907149 [Trichophaea hybrida]|nr:hypothetical protein BDD12DRAFT_907149 [Trichophaea hybrida]